MKSYHRLLLIGLISYALYACGGGSGETASSTPGNGHGLSNDGDLHLFYIKKNRETSSETSIYAYNTATQVSTIIGGVDHIQPLISLSEDTYNNTNHTADASIIIYSKDNKIYYIDSFNPSPLLILEDESISTICLLTVTNSRADTVVGEVIHYLSATDDSTCSTISENLTLHSAIIENNLTAAIQTNAIPPIPNAEKIYNGFNFIGQIYPLDNKLFFIESAGSTPIEIFNNTREITKFYIKRNNSDSSYFVVINQNLFAVSNAALLSTGQLGTPIYESYLTIPNSFAFSDNDLYLIGSRAHSPYSIREIIRVSLSTHSANSIYTLPNDNDNDRSYSPDLLAQGDVVIAYHYDEVNDQTAYSYIQSNGTLLDTVYINGRQGFSANTQLNNKLMINHQNGDQFIAIALSENPSDYDIYINSFWSPTNYRDNGSVILINNESGLAGSLAGAQLQLFTSAAGGHALNLGFLPDKNYVPSFMFSFAIDDYMGISFFTKIENFSADADYFVVDLTTENSLYSVATSDETLASGL